MLGETVNQLGIVERDGVQYTEAIDPHLLRQWASIYSDGRARSACAHDGGIRYAAE